MAWRTLGRVGGGLVGAAAGAFCIKQLQEKRAQAASVMLQNLLASKADPGSLTRQEVMPVATSAAAKRLLAANRCSPGRCKEGCGVRCAHGMASSCVGSGLTLSVA